MVLGVISSPPICLVGYFLLVEVVVVRGSGSDGGELSLGMGWRCGAM